jgi:GTP pyrophosphokinase
MRAVDMVKSAEQKSEVFLTRDEQSLLDRVGSYDASGKYFSKLAIAIQFAKRAHAGQKRASGEDFFTHPLTVAKILASVSMDSLTIIAALLHDVVEDTKVSIKEIEEIFGVKVASLVDGVTKLTKIEGKSKNLQQVENFKKLIIAISQDIRVLIIKLADRLHNMQTLAYISSEDKRGRIALETMEIYAPLAERVGMHGIKTKLQDLAFAALYPASRDSILQRLDLLKKGDSPRIIRKISDSISSLMKENGIQARVMGREKTPFSIWEKMKRKSISFGQLSDVMAFRVLVPDVSSCYKTVGVIHTKYHAVPGLFKDFISLPKQNRYKSIHTVIIGPEDHRIEIQIRTEEMHEVAENGIAAHWSYKQKYEDVDKEGYNWVKGLFNLSEETNNFSELLDNTKLEIYVDQIFCFTPKGSVVSLPKGASVVDFAYAVHSDLGNSVVGARINYKIAPIKTKLQNGDQVEIITSKTQRPLASWEQFVVTGKALNEIRKITKGDRDKELFTLGKSLLVRIFMKQKEEFSIEKLKPGLIFFGKTSIEELICAVGDGSINPDDVFKQIYPKSEVAVADSFYFLKHRKNKKSNGNCSITIKGLTDGVGVHLAPCCSPIPGDHIVGIRVTSKGVTVHTLGCETLQNYVDDPGLWLDLSWDNDTSKGVFVGSINIVMQNVIGALAEVIVEISKSGINIVNLKVLSRTHDFFEINLDVETKGLRQLSNIISAVKSKESVHSVNRIM